MIKILIVDDSATETTLLKHLFHSEKDMSVVGTAVNGQDALKIIPSLKPDIITMDIHMPVMNGFETIRQIMALHPTPIVVISEALSNPELNATFKALEAGALSVLQKPRNVNSKDFPDDRKRIIETVRSMSEIKVVRRKFHRSKKSIETIYKKTEIENQPFEIIAIGASVGGPQALRAILEKLPADFPIPIVVVQHMTVGFMQGFTKWLDAITKIEVKCTSNHEILRSGTVYFAPDEHHLEIYRRQENLMTRLVKKDPVSGFCPSATVLLQSVAKTSGKNAIGILLTGMGHDGAIGLLELKKAGGLTLIQDEESAIVFGMAGSAKAIGAVDKIVPLSEMADFLVRITHKTKVV